MNEAIVKMNEHERLEQHWNILLLVHQMIRFSELKAGMVITLFSVLLTLIFAAKDVLSDTLSESVVFLVLVCVFTSIMCISFFFSVRAFFPRFFDKNPRSVIYYGDIHKEFKDYQEYSSYLTKACDNGPEMELQLAEQIHTLSGIADSKFQNVKLAVRYLIVSLSVLLATVVVYFIL